jgi:hypothetical protein
VRAGKPTRWPAALRTLWLKSFLRCGWLYQRHASSLRVVSLDDSYANELQNRLCLIFVNGMSSLCCLGDVPIPNTTLYCTVSAGRNALSALPICGTSQAGTIRKVSLELVAISFSERHFL